MRTRHTPALFALVLAIALAPGTAAAVLRPYALTLSPFAGGYVFEGNQRLENRPLYGLAVGYTFSENWGVEGVASYVDGQAASDHQDNVDIYGVHLDLLYHFRPDRHFIPYVTAGLGGLSVHSGGEGEESGLFNYGVGLKYFLSDNIGLRADVRHILDINVNDADRQRDLYNNLSYSAGLTFQFGGIREAPEHRDTDGDGVVDKFDRCPGTQLGVPVDGFGCPADSDRDTVFDYLDQCPDTPFGALVDQAGCPPAAQGVTPTVPIAQAAPSLTLHLQFASGAAAIRPEFENDLQAAADFIKAHPAGRILVEGHTDSIGLEETNLALSKMRAVEVRRVLVEKYKLDADRIETEGFGEARPVADNATPEGRMRNRRVVITVLPAR